ncbi:hypothetical protein AB0K12_42650 [Nonomuraea sp. NPDC049419]|uniref:hypothetical protein n=1 Tax=Nonomuraea sp. NPDC049419 TaxID=3155772 RepID=UPI003435F27A
MGSLDALVASFAGDSEVIDVGRRLLVRFAPGGTGVFEVYCTFTVDGPSIVKAELTYAD